MKNFMGLDVLYKLKKTTFYKLFFQNKKTFFCFKKIIVFQFLILTFTIKSLSGETFLLKNNEGISFQVDEIANDLGIPWGMVFISPSKLLFTERKGKIGILDTANGKIIRIQGEPQVFAFGQGGLLDVAVSYKYKAGDWIYFTYSKKQSYSGSNKFSTTLARAKLNGNHLVNFNDLFISKPARDSSIHFGSRITFDANGKLFFTIGDRGTRQDAQNLSSHSGSILRLNLDGSIPHDNPFINQKGALPEIWSFGHRNPQGIFYDRKLNRLWSIEHGPRGGDEINLILAGRNYGWPVISYGKEYWGPVQVGEGTEKEGMEQPIKFYVPSIAPGSIIKYSGKAFPDWKGNLFASSLKLMHLNRIVLDDNGKAIHEERLLENLGERIRALVESTEGWIYFSTDRGKIMSLRPVENKK